MVTPEDVLAIEWSFLAVTYTLVGLRIAVRLVIQRRKLLLSDLLLLPAALCILGIVICDTITYQMGAMANLGQTSESLGKIQFATSYLFDFGMYLPKLSMLAFYFQLFPVHEVLLRRALYVITVFVVLSAVASLTLRTFWCGLRPWENWSTDPRSCSTYRSFTILQINWVFCFVSELLVFTLPFFLLSQLRTLVGRERLGLILVFTLGAITLLTSIGRFAAFTTRVCDLSLYIWPNAEFSVSIMVVACTALRPLLRKFCSCTSPRRTPSKIPPLPFSLARITVTDKRSTQENTSSHSTDVLMSRDVTDAEAGVNNSLEGGGPYSVFEHDVERDTSFQLRTFSTSGSRNGAA